MHGDVLAGIFSSKLMKIGERKITANNDGRIQLSPNVCHLVQNVDESISCVPNINENDSSNDWLYDRAILASTNNIVTNINQQIL